MKEIVVALENADPASGAGPIGGCANLGILTEHFTMKPDEKAGIKKQLEKEYELK